MRSQPKALNTKATTVNETDQEYAKRLHIDATAVLDGIKADFDRGQSMQGAINWGDLHVTSIENRRSFYGDGVTVDSWHVVLEEASPHANDLRQAVSLGLVERGHVGVNVETEW